MRWLEHPRGRCMVQRRCVVGVTTLWLCVAPLVGCGDTAGSGSEARPKTGAESEANDDAALSAPDGQGALDAALAGDSVADDAATAGPWEPLPDDAPRPADARLCPASADPASAPDKIFIDCALDTGRFAPQDPPPTDALVVWAYNIERGHGVDGQLALLAEDADVPRPDVILLSEVDRGCERTGERHIVLEYAQKLSMDFVYGTEFVELVRGDWTHPCEHGNAVLSRYPLGNVEAIRHAVNDSWYESEGEPRLGGRVAVRADVRVPRPDGTTSTVRLFSLHLESAIGHAARTAQAKEIAALSLASPYPAVAGGDLNTGLFFSDVLQAPAYDPDNLNDPTVAAFVQEGFVDSHYGMEHEVRITHPKPASFILDLLLALPPLSWSAPGVCRTAVCDGLSDHRPVWAVLALP
jgi:endonuclease/exonuclease/phosphatase family metal-dependent hydrolase